MAICRASLLNEIEPRAFSIGSIKCSLRLRKNAEHDFLMRNMNATFSVEGSAATRRCASSMSWQGVRSPNN